VRTPIGLVALTLIAAAARGASAQVGVSAGAGGGIAGSTDASLSEGRTAAVVMAQATASVAPAVGLGVQLDSWLRSGAKATFATAHLQLHVPLTGFFVKLGAGVGSGDPDGKGPVSGPAFHLGAAYDVSVTLAPASLTLFGNALLAHASQRSMQMVDFGLAVTVK
jgi:hypothetical protein